MPSSKREVTDERIRDKVAASKRKGMWMGGYPPIGYDAHEHQMVVNDAEALTVKEIFARYLHLGSVRLLKQEPGWNSLEAPHVAPRTSLGRRTFSRGALYKLLSNPIFIGEIRHKDTSYPGLHTPIIDRETWARTAAQLHQRETRPSNPGAGGTPNPLLGKLFDEHGEGLPPTHTKKGQRRYRYYVSRSLLTGGRGHEGWRLAAAELENVVRIAARQILADRSLLVAAVEGRNLDASAIAALLGVAAEQRQRLESSDQDNAQLRALVARVQLQPQSLRLTLQLSLPTATNRDDTVGITHDAPLQIRRRGVEKRLLISGALAPPARIDQSLLKAVARAHCWLDDLTTGRITSMAVIAEREGVGKRYVSRVIRLGLLAPAIVEMIAAGAQAPAAH